MPKGIGWNFFYLSLLILLLSLPAFSQEWTAQTSGVTQNFLGVSFPDANNGWAVGVSGTILRTTNAGSSWTSQTSGTTNNLFSVSFPDANNGWAVGFNGTILKTSNGGTNWTSQTSGTTQVLRGVSFPDANNGWAVGGFSVILRTTNGGSNWISQNSGVTQTFYSVTFTDANTGWAVATGGIIRKTTDGGTNWTGQTSGTTQNLFNVAFRDANNGFITGSRGTILKTTNGGTNWTSQTSGTIIALNGVSFPNADTGWVVGSSGIILTTTDGGTSWASQTSGTTGNLNSVKFTDAYTGWAVGASGTILHYIFADWTQPQSDNTGPGNTNSWTPTLPTDPNTGGVAPVGFAFAALSSGSNPSAISARHNIRTNAVSTWGLSSTELDAAMPSNTTINRFWDIITTGGLGMNCSVTLRFNTTDIPAGITDPTTQITYAYHKHGAGAWISSPCVVTGPVSGVYTATINGVSTFSYWGLGSQGVLPVELTSFSAVSGDGIVNLSWRVESETDNRCFRIYRSEDATVIGTVQTEIAGRGTTSQAKTYYWSDTRVENGKTYYYRLSDVSLDGIEQMHPQRVNATPRQNIVVVPSEYSLSQNYPNPFNPTTSISFSLKATGNADLRVYNMTGREVAVLSSGRMSAGYYHVSFDGSRLPSGMYFYRLQTEDFSSIKKMMLVK